MPDVLKGIMMYKIPWHVWPLRPIVVWAILIALLMLWPLLTLIGFCILSYGTEIWVRVAEKKEGLRQKGVFSFFMAPLKLIVVLIVMLIGGRFIL